MPSTLERGYALAAVRALGRQASARCHARSADCGRWADWLAATDPAARAEEAQLTGALIPRGVGRIHPTWYDPPPDAREPRARAFLARVAYGHLVAMDGKPDARVGRLEALTAEELERLIRRLGLKRLALSFANAPSAIVAQVCARLGEPAASELLAERATGRASRALSEAMRISVTVALPADELFAEGAAWLAGLLKEIGQDAAQRLAQRLARPLGTYLVAAVDARPPGSTLEKEALSQAMDHLLPKGHTLV